MIRFIDAEKQKQIQYRILLIYIVTYQYITFLKSKRAHLLQFFFIRKDILMEVNAFAL